MAKTDAAHRKLQRQFEARSPSKTYVALVKGRVEFEEGAVDKAIGHHEKMRRKMAVSRAAGAREALTRYKVRKRFPGCTLLEIELHTGRTHQIRVHMAHLGNPVVGDELYGSRKEGERLMLHAWKLAFEHPNSGKIMTFKSDWPEDFKKMIESLERS